MSSYFELSKLPQRVFGITTRSYPIRKSVMGPTIGWLHRNDDSRTIMAEYSQNIRLSVPVDRPASEGVTLLKNTSADLYDDDDIIEKLDPITDPIIILRSHLEASRLKVKREASHS